jgi:hypothetical protein
MEKISGSCLVSRERLVVMVDRLIPKVQSVAFWSATILAVTFVIVIDLFDWTDPCLVIYGVDTLVAFICASMFADWWRVQGAATSIYKWLTILLFALCFNDALQFYARFVFAYSPTKYAAILDSWLWSYRSMPKMIALIYLFSFAVWQRFGTGVQEKKR